MELAVYARVLGLGPFQVLRVLFIYAEARRLQRKLPPQGICPQRSTRRLLGLCVLWDTSSRSFSLWRFNIGLDPIWAFVRASKVSRTGPQVNPESIPPTLAPKIG